MAVAVMYAINRVEYRVIQSITYQFTKDLDIRCEFGRMVVTQLIEVDIF